MKLKGPVVPPTGEIPVPVECRVRIPAMPAEMLAAGVNLDRYVAASRSRDRTPRRIQRRIARSARDLHGAAALARVGNERQARKFTRHCPATVGAEARDMPRWRGAQVEEWNLRRNIECCDCASRIFLLAASLEKSVAALGASPHAALEEGRGLSLPFLSEESRKQRFAFAIDPIAGALATAMVPALLQGWIPFG
ncbi:hypothetical protein [Variovorax paradoxus]|uniref:hypothetical protein n=1 Tax=Variovorax paradoxus TaxID=34073 RepID=UPI003D64C47F